MWEELHRLNESKGTQLEDLIDDGKFLDNFLEDKNAWDYTKGITIEDAALQMPTGATTHINTALNKVIKNPRAIEYKIKDSEGIGSYSRIAMGKDKKNFAFLVPANRDIWTVVNGSLGTQYTGKLASSYQIKNGDKIKAVVRGQNVQLFANDFLKGTFEPGFEMLGEYYAGMQWRDSGNNVKYDQATVYENTVPKYMHFSVDDFIDALEDLTNGSYTSLWDQPTFALFKDMHDQYGVVVSLYCFYQNSTFNLSQTTDAFKNEFLQASNWLKFGFHALDNPSRYETDDAAQAKTAYQNTINEIIRFAGERSLDLLPRIHYFQGREEVIQEWKSTTHPPKGFLSAEDDREINYNLSAVERETLSKCDDYYEVFNDLYFAHTDLRLENVSDVVSELNTLKSSGGQRDIQILFTHENKLELAEVQQQMNDGFRWAIDNQFVFAFPQEHIPKC
ncbi:hypothetical protein [Halobacillus salinus]|uniref:Uncharacterized protein n=1 Tax=Halobacillus salinus TaxID=192814 RepID=A0A4Z0H6F8_9BACI|nr:hypothetical protein [Halobacillus salinus]TGB04685.1 hypothetical protein E4663_06755 [Halobacillus salinus]